ncbi:hypothetical protein B0H11DRAFT_2322463 [Mycena galericulata]|nr:hypothetical protein B0H11DRAFT_2322463 [Mycena galericulata]
MMGLAECGCKRGTDAHKFWSPEISLVDLRSSQIAGRREDESRRQADLIAGLRQRRSQPNVTTQRVIPRFRLDSSLDLNHLAAAAAQRNCLAGVDQVAMALVWKKSGTRSRRLRLESSTWSLRVLQVRAVRPSSQSGFIAICNNHLRLIPFPNPQAHTMLAPVVKLTSVQNVAGSSPSPYPSFPRTGSRPTNRIFLSEQDYRNIIAHSCITTASENRKQRGPGAGNRLQIRGVQIYPYCLMAISLASSTTSQSTPVLLKILSGARFETDAALLWPPAEQGWKDIDPGIPREK